MRIYLAGPMSGMPDLNFPAFERARNKLRAEGHEVFCPAEATLNAGWEVSESLNSDPNFRREVLAIDLAWICANAEAIALLPQWERSVGATAERATGIALGLLIMELD